MKEARAIPIGESFMERKEKKSNASDQKESRSDHRIDSPRKLADQHTGCNRNHRCGDAPPTS